MRNGLERSGTGEVESRDVTGASGVDDVDKVSLRSDGDGLAASAGRGTEKSESCAANVEDGDVAAAGINCEKERMILSERERSLGGERIGETTTAAASGGEGVAPGQSAVGIARVGDDLIVTCVVGHNEDCAGGCVSLRVAG